MRTRYDACGGEQEVTGGEFPVVHQHQLPPS
jgi:hypothetical protein